MNASAVKLFDFEHFVHKMDRELLPKVHRHRLRTPNEGKKQRNLKNWADGADIICCGCT